MDADAGEAAVKRRQRIDRPHISIAIRQSGEGMRAASVICQFLSKCNMPIEKRFIF
jgi:hypothetical protein